MPGDVGEARDGDTALSLAGAVGADVSAFGCRNARAPESRADSPFQSTETTASHFPVSRVDPSLETELCSRTVLKAGADGYIDEEQLIASAPPRRFGGCSSGKKYVSPALAEELVLDLNRGSERQPHETLGNGEYQVFLQLGAGNSIDQIARELTLSPKTVRTYKSRILEKMDLRSTAQLIFYAVREGLITEVVPGVRDDIPEGKPTPVKSTPAKIENRRIPRK